MVTKIVKKIIGEPKKSNSSYGKWVVTADCDFFSEETKRSWNHPSVPFFFFNKKSAIKFISEVSK